MLESRIKEGEKIGRRRRSGRERKLKRGQCAGEMVGRERERERERETE